MGLFSLPLTDRRAALEAVVKSLGPGFVAEFNKHKSLQAAGLGSSGSGKSPSSHGPLGKMPGNMKKPLKSVSPKAAKKDMLSLPGSSSSPESDDSPQDKEVEEDEEELPAGTSGPRPSPYNRVSFSVFFSVIWRICFVSHCRGIMCGRINCSVR